MYLSTASLLISKAKQRSAGTIVFSVWPDCSCLGRVCKFSLVRFSLAYPVTFLIVAKHHWRALIPEIYLRLLNRGGVNICSECKDRAGPNCFFNDVLIISSCIFITLMYFVTDEVERTFPECCFISRFNWRHCGRESSEVISMIFVQEMINRFMFTREIYNFALPIKICTTLLTCLSSHSFCPCISKRLNTL